MDRKPINITPNEIHDQILVEYVNYLSSARGSKKNLHPTTVGDALGAVRIVLNALTTRLRWGFISSWISERVPSGPAGAAKKSEPTEVLSLVSMKEIARVANGSLATLEALEPNTGNRESRISERQ